MRGRLNFERVERAICERIEIDSSVLSNFQEFEEGAAQSGLPVIGARGPVAKHGLFTLNLYASASRHAVRINEASISASILKSLALATHGILARTVLALFLFIVRRSLFSTGASLTYFTERKLPGSSISIPSKRLIGMQGHLRSICDTVWKTGSTVFFVSEVLFCSKLPLVEAREPAELRSSPI